MNVLSLFDGMSCGRIALEKCGIKVDNYFACEIDAPAMRVTMHNYPDTEQLGDVTKISAFNLPKIDLLIGGSPCQGFSNAGLLQNFEDPRSKLFFEFVRLMDECKPRFFLLENVNMKKEWRDVISGHMGVQPLNINSSLVSAAKRNRLYWTNIPGAAVPEDLGVTFDDIAEDGTMFHDQAFIDRVKAWKAQQKPFDHVTVRGKKMKLPCLTARGYNQYHSGMILVEENGRFRYLTNTEAERAHNIPEGYTAIGNDRERSHMIGNGWTVGVIAHLFSGLK